MYPKSVPISQYKGHVTCSVSNLLLAINCAIFLISNFRLVLNVACFLLGNSPASEFYMLTFWNTLSVPSSYANRYEEILGLRLFSSHAFSRINTPAFSNIFILHTYPPMKVEQTECSETSAYKIQTQRNYPEESIQSWHILPVGIYVCFCVCSNRTFFTWNFTGPAILCGSLGKCSIIYLIST